MNSKYYYGQDGMVVSDEFINIFDLRTKEVRYSDKTGKNVFDFVGFVFRGEKTLVVFPKNYYNEKSIESLNVTHIKHQEDIRLLFNVIQTYRKKEKTKSSSKTYIGAIDGYDSNYPFRAFYNIYDYYQKYGLYTEKENKLVKGSQGKILWKKTISKSNKIISDGNLIFSPLYTSIKQHNNVFLTECMAFIIDYTIDYFQDFISLKKTGIIFKFDYLRNIDYTILQLKRILNNNFKDINKHLIKNMIEFFEYFKLISKGGNIHIEVRYFDMIWQMMIASYINKHFYQIDLDSGIAIFKPDLKQSVVTFSNKTYDDIDTSDHKFSIDIDHAAYHNNILYIFDSKYYTKVTDLNYKQFSYNELLRYHYPGIDEIHNILFLPGENHYKIHFSFGIKYIGNRTIGNRIIEQYIHPKIVMEDYLK